MKNPTPMLPESPPILEKPLPATKPSTPIRRLGHLLLIPPDLKTGSKRLFEIEIHYAPK